MEFSSLSALVSMIRELSPGRRIVVFGSSSFLASFPTDSPASLGVEVTIDADIFIDPDSDEARSALAHVMGQGRTYHQEHGYYCDFVDAHADAWFPSRWKERVVPFPGVPGVFALDPVDAAAAKLVATAHSRVDTRLGRRRADRGTKDIDTLVALVSSGRLRLGDVSERIQEIELDGPYRAETSIVEKMIVGLCQGAGG